MRGCTKPWLRWIPICRSLSIRSLKEQIAGQFSQERLIARLTSLFGLLSLVLASIGLYGVTAYNAGMPRYRDRRPYGAGRKTR